MAVNRNLLCIDDEENIINSLKRFLRKEEYTLFTAGSAEEGMELLDRNEIGVVLSDLMMPGMDGLTFFDVISKTHKDTVKILLTGHASIESTLEAINRLSLFGYLIKPWPASELKSTLKRAFDHYNLIVENRELQKLTEEQNRELSRTNEILEIRVEERTVLLEDALREGIMMLATAAEKKDKYTGDHLNRIRELTLKICKGMNFSDDQSETVSFFSVTHDVGKIHIPDNVLNKTGKLSNDEWNVMKHHTIAGDTILGKKSYYKTAREIARSHHENWDGTGYPDGLSGNDIPLAARIVSIADVYDALTNDRPYKDRWPQDKAISEMKQLSGIKFDPDIMNVFLKIIELKE